MKTMVCWKWLIYEKKIRLFVQMVEKCVKDVAPEKEPHL